MELFKVRFLASKDPAQPVVLRSAPGLHSETGNRTVRGRSFRGVRWVLNLHQLPDERGVGVLPASSSTLWGQGQSSSVSWPEGDKAEWDAAARSRQKLELLYQVEEPQAD